MDGLKQYIVSLQVAKFIHTGLPHPEKVLDFFAVLESPGILFISLGKSLKICGRFPTLHRDRIVKLLSLIISTKIRYMKE